MRWTVTLSPTIAKEIHTINHEAYFLKLGLNGYLLIKKNSLYKRAVCSLLGPRPHLPPFTLQPPHALLPPLNENKN